MSDQTPRRGRDVSSTLTEVRTVLSRAETAAIALARPEGLEHVLTEDASNPSGTAYTFIRDPDQDEMRADLFRVVAILARWRKTGRPAPKCCELSPHTWSPCRPEHVKG